MKNFYPIKLDFFSNYKGYIHCDGYGGYDALATKSKDIILSGCLYHVRRKFVEIIKITNAKEGVACDVIKYIGLLAKIEEEIKELSVDTKFNARMQRAKPVLDELHQYLIAVHPKILPKSALGQAVNYALNQWPKLLIYLQDGRFKNNNNRSERAIKPFVIGRKACFSLIALQALKLTATIFSLIETCKQHEVTAYDWFRYVLQQLPLCGTEAEIESLLPFNIDRKLLVREAV